MLKKLDPRIPAGKIKSETPIKANAIVQKRPPVVIAYTSPKPVVVYVIIPIHNVVGISPNFDG